MEVELMRVQELHPHTLIIAYTLFEIPPFGGISKIYFRVEDSCSPSSQHRASRLIP